MIEVPPFAVSKGGKDIVPVLLVKPKRFADDRGWFSETYHQARYAELGIEDVFVQDNHSFSVSVGVIRGLHFQTPPHAQAKLLRCIRGRIWDVAVDIRKGSPSFGHWTAAELSAENGEQLYVPTGFAHGFVTLEPHTEVVYKVSNLYAPEADGGIAWDDPALGLPWPLPETGPIVSGKDATLPTLARFDSPFPYDGRPLVPLTV